MAKARNRFLLASSTSVGAWTMTPTIPAGKRLRELWLEWSGDAAAGVTPSFPALGELLIRQTGPANSGQLGQATTLAQVVTMMNRRGGIADFTYVAGGAGNFGSLCIYFAYAAGDKRNCLHFQDGQGLNISLGATGGGAAVWDSLTTELYAVYADDDQCTQLYVPHYSETQIPLGGSNPFDMEGNLLEYSCTAATVTNPTSLQLLTGSTVEDEGSWEGLKRMANSIFPIEATQTTLQSVLHDELDVPADVLRMVRNGTTLRFNGGSGNTQLFQVWVDFNADTTAASITQVRSEADAFRKKLRESQLINAKLKSLLLPAVRPTGETITTRNARTVHKGNMSGRV